MSSEDNIRVERFGSYDFSDDFAMSPSPVDTTGLSPVTAKILTRIAQFIIPNWQDAATGDLILPTGMGLFWDELLENDSACREAYDWLKERCDTFTDGSADHPWWPIWFEFAEIDAWMDAEIKRSQEQKLSKSLKSRVKHDIPTKENPLG